MVQVNIDNVVDKAFVVLLLVLGALAANYVLTGGIVAIVSTLVSAF